MQLQLSLKCQYKWSRSVQYNIIVSIGSTGTRTHICYNYIDHLRLCKSKNNRLIKVTLISVIQFWLTLISIEGNHRFDVQSHLPYIVCIFTVQLDLAS